MATTSIQDQFAKLSGQIKTVPAKVSVEVTTTDNGDEPQLPVLLDSDNLEQATKGDTYFQAVTEEGTIMNFKERRISKDSRHKTPEVTLGHKAVIKTADGEEIQIPVTEAQVHTLWLDKLESQRSTRWANNAQTAFVVVGTLLMAFGIAIGVKKEVRNQP